MSGADTRQETPAFSGGMVRWNRAVELDFTRLGNPRHDPLRIEGLVDDAETEREMLRDVLALDPDKSLLAYPG